MRHPLFILAIALVAAPSSAAFAQDREVYMAQCLDDDAGIAMAGCTALIETGEETDRNLAVSYFHRGRAHRKMQDLDRAIQDFDEAIRLRPGFLNAFFQRGDAYLAKEDYDSAIRDFSEVVVLNPEDAVAFRYRGNAYFAKMDLERAIADYDEALRLEPDDTESQEARARASPGQ
jgi:tetratricopeptide (TPR) repeat protein